LRNERMEEENSLGAQGASLWEVVGGDMVGNGGEKC
jgi:hypothetical protein